MEYIYEKLPIDLEAFGGDSRQGTFKVIHPETKRYIYLDVWVASCGIHFIRGFSNMSYYISVTRPEKAITLVEDILTDINTRGAGTLKLFNFPIMDIYFVLAGEKQYAPKDLVVGEEFGKLTKLINSHINGAHGPNHLYMFHSSFKKV